MARPEVYDAVAVHAVAGESNVYEGNVKLQPMNKAVLTAFGGCVMSQCISAAFASLPTSSGGSDQFQLYSVLGNFLGPGSTEVVTRYHVEEIRTTRSFATRKVEAWQDLGGSTQYKGRPEDAKRRIVILLFDFQKPEKRSIMEYNVLPIYADAHKQSFTDAVSRYYSSPETLDLARDYIDKTHGSAMGRVFSRTFSMFERNFDSRINPRSMAGQTVFGLASGRESKEDHLPIIKRTYSTWARARPSAGPPAEDEASLPDPPGLPEAALAYFMDGSLGFLPLTFSGLFLDKVQAFSTLELSLRFFNHPIVFDDWVLQEQTTEVGNAGKTFSTGRVWNREGKLIASMSQVCILRPWPEGHAAGRAAGKDAQAKL